MPTRNSLRSPTLLACALACALSTAVAQAPAKVDPAKPTAADCESSEDRRAPSEAEQLALTAIEGLMVAPPERAVPVLKRVLAGPQSVLVKKRALFVLAQQDRQDGTATLIELARNNASPLKCEAIRNIGISGNTQALAVLPEFYGKGDPATRKAVLQALLIAGRKAEVLQIANAAKSDAELAEAVRTLSAMGATEELRKLGGTLKGHRVLIEAYAVSGDLPALRKLAQGGDDLPTRIEATQAMGIVGTDAAREALRQVYTTSREPGLRDAALKGLHIANDQKGVLALYRAATTAEERQRLLRVLTLMGGDAALEAIDAALDAKPAVKK